MEGTYPLIIDGALVGKLTVVKRGPQTAFDITSKMLTGIVRVSVYGEGKEGYLGVLAPEGDGLGLHKTLSRSAMQNFPATIDTVERAGGQAQQDAVPAQPEAVPVAGAASEPVPEKEEKAEAEPEPEPPPVRREQDNYWYASPDGALVCFDGTRNLIALPLGDPRIPANARGERRRVDGRDYLVFPTKNGRVQWDPAVL